MSQTYKIVLGLWGMLLFFCSQIASAQLNTGNVAFKHVNVIPMNENIVLSDQVVLIKGDQISEIGESKKVAIPEGYEIIEARGKFLMPGLADMHTHVGHQDDLPPYIAYGVTTILNLGSLPEILRLREEVKAGRLQGPDIYAAAFIDGVPPGFITRSPEEAKEKVDVIHQMGWDFIKVYNSLSAASFDAVMEKAEEYNIPVIGHGVRDPGMEHILGKGVVMIAHMEEFIYTMFNNDERYDLISDAVTLAKEYEIYITPTLSTYEAISHQMGNRAGFDSLMSLPEMRMVRNELKEKWQNNPRYINQNRNIWRFLTLQKEMLRQFHQAGIPMMTGTDTPFQGMVQGLSIFRDLEWMTMAGMSNYEALKTATVHPGNFIEKYTSSELKVGTVKVGNKANLLLLDGNPLDHLDNIKRQFGVILQGKWYTTKEIRSRMEENIKSW